MKFLRNVNGWLRSGVARVSEFLSLRRMRVVAWSKKRRSSLHSRWTFFAGQMREFYLTLQIKREKCLDRLWEFYYRRRRNLVERTACVCAWFIDWRNDIRVKLDEIFQSRLIAAQTQHPVKIVADVQNEATWMFFRTTHPVITTDHLTFNGSRMQFKKQTPMVRALFQIPGVAEVALMRYNVRITRGSIFPVNELTPKIMEVLREHLV